MLSAWLPILQHFMSTQGASFIFFYAENIDPSLLANVNKKVSVS